MTLAHAVDVRRSARELIDLVLDPGSFASWDLPIVRPADLDPAYVAELERAELRSGADESVLTGCGTLHGRRVAVIISEFRFLGGSIGIAAANRLVDAVTRATREGLPLLAATASGGTRMQEGTPAFVQMVRVTDAICAHRGAGLPYLVYLRHPTTGGVFASWGSLGQITAAEPDALVGFLGPKVFEGVHGDPFPAGVQHAENLVRSGVIDAVLPPERLREALGRVLTVVGSPWRGPATAPAIPDEPQPQLPAWFGITATRREDRPGVRELLRHAATDVVSLSGSGAGESAPGLALALARFGGRPCVVLGQDRASQAVHGAAGPEALRVARRGMRIAAELDLPVVSVIDTPGAALSPAAEEGALAGEIARSMADLTQLASPVISVLLGQGAGGLALSMLPGDRVIAARHAWLSPLPPEGASVIVHGDTDHAAELAARQRVRAVELLELGIVDRIVPEHDDAADEPEAFSLRLGEAIAQELACVGARDPRERQLGRMRRYAFG